MVGRIFRSTMIFSGYVLSAWERGGVGHPNILL